MLCDYEIDDLVTRGREMITPYSDRLVSAVEGKPVISWGLGSFGYDFRLGTAFAAPVKTEEPYDPKHANELAYTRFEVEAGEPVPVPPGDYILGHSVEYLKIPEFISALCVGKSTYARYGVDVLLTPLEAGWEGQITVEIANRGKVPVFVYPGEGIAQLQFFRGNKPNVTYASRGGKYQGQKGVTLGKV